MQAADIGQAHGFRHNVGGKGGVVHAYYRQAGAVDGNAVTDFQILQYLRRSHCQVIGFTLLRQLLHLSIRQIPVIVIYRPAV